MPQDSLPLTLMKHLISFDCITWVWKNENSYMPSPIDVTTFLLLHIVFMKLTCPQTCFCSHWCLLWFRTIEIIFQFFFGNGSTLESLLLANRRVFPSHMQFLSKSRIYRLFQRKKCFNFIRMPLIFQRWL